MQKSKRMLMTVGDSRVGKSTIVKLLMDWFHLQKKTIKVYDHDNRDRLKAYENLVPIEKLNFFNDQTDKMLNDLNNNELDIILVDMPGQYVDKICQYILESVLLELLIEYEWSLTFISPISHRRDCINYLNQLINTATNNANYLVIKNQHFATNFLEYQSIQNVLPMIGGTDIELLPLHRDHYEAMEKAGKPYFQCYQDTSIYVVYRSYIYRWLNNFRNSVMGNSLASKYLGLSK